MTETTANDNLVPQMWRMANLRFTAFVSEMPFPENGGELFQDFFGFTHDDETCRKREFMSEFSSKKDGVLYQTTISGQKVDFTVSPDISPVEVPDVMPSLPLEGDFETMFRDAAKRLVAKTPKFVRLAVGAHFILPSVGKKEGYAVMQKFLPNINIDSSGSSDFQYRINRRVTRKGRIQGPVGANAGPPGCRARPPSRVGR